MESKHSEYSADDEYYMYILINNDLKMGKGKIASQACHSVAKATRILDVTTPQSYLTWMKTGEAKIVLKATESEMKQIINDHGINDVNNTFKKNFWCVYTYDIGRTQIAPNSLTSMAFCPVKKRDAPDFIRALKLL